MSRPNNEPSDAEITSAAKEGHRAYFDEETKEHNRKKKRRVRSRSAKLKDSKDPSEKPPKEFLEREKKRNAP